MNYRKRFIFQNSLDFLVAIKRSWAQATSLSKLKSKPSIVRIKCRFFWLTGTMPNGNLLPCHVTPSFSYFVRGPGRTLFSLYLWPKYGQSLCLSFPFLWWNKLGPSKRLHQIPRDSKGETNSYSDPRLAR